MASVAPQWKRPHFGKVERIGCVRQAAKGPPFAYARTVDRSGRYG